MSDLFEIIAGKDPSPIIGYPVKVGLRRVKMPTEKLVEVVTADVAIAVDAEKRVNDCLVQIWKLKFGNKVNFLFRL